MSSNLKKDFNEILNIEIAIELDKGESINDVARKFEISTALVRTINKKTIFSRKIKPKLKKRIYSQQEKLVLVERIGNGAILEEIAEEQGLNKNTLRKWCKFFKVPIPRRLENISNTEKNEIRELLKNNDWQDIAKIYNISKESIEDLRIDPHCRLDNETLTYLFELLREKPVCSAKTICKIMKKEGFTVLEEEVNSYKKRLRSLKII